MSVQARRVVGGLAGAAAMIAMVNIASRLVGFLRWFVMASEVGPNALGDAYTAANTVPNIIFEVAAGGALAGAVVPLIAAPLARSIQKDVDRTASALLGWAMAVLVPLALVVALFSRPIVAVFLPGGTDSQLEVGGVLLSTFALQLPLYGLGVVLTGVLQAQGRFLAAALAPLLNSAVVIAVFVVFGRMVMTGKDDPASIAPAAIQLLGWGTTAGVAVMSLSLLGPVLRTGVRLRPALGFPPGVARQARALALAGLGALVAQQVSVAVGLRVAKAYGEDGTLSVFAYTQAVYFLPYAVLGHPLAAAGLPRLAAHAARAHRAGFAALTAATTRTVLLASGIGAAALVAVAPAVEQVFAPIADGSVRGMGTALTWMAPGLLGFALILHLSRALYAQHRGRLAVTATAAGWLVVAGSALALAPQLTGGRPDQVATLQALGIASSLGMSAAGVGLVLGIVRAAGRPAVRGVPRTVLVLLLGGVAAAWLGRALVVLVLGTGGGGSVVRALAAGVVGAVVVVAVVVAVMGTADRSVLHALRPVPSEGADGGSSGSDVQH